MYTQARCFLIAVHVDEVDDVERVRLQLVQPEGDHVAALSRIESEALENIIEELACS